MDRKGKYKLHDNELYHSTLQHIFLKVIRCGKNSEIGCQRIFFFFFFKCPEQKNWLILLQHAIVRFDVAQCPFSALLGFFSFFQQSGNALLVRLDDRSFTLPAAVLCCLLSV